MPSFNTDIIAIYFLCNAYTYQTLLQADINICMHGKHNTEYIYISKAIEYCELCFYLGQIEYLSNKLHVLMYCASATPSE